MAIAISRDAWTAVAIGSAVVLVGMAIYGLASGPSSPKAIPTVQPWETRPIRALQGLPITISVPRGEQFLVASPDVLLQAQAQRGMDTHLVIVPLITGEPTYTIQTVVVDRTTNKTYPIEIRAEPIEAYVPAVEAGA